LIYADFEDSLHSKTNPNQMNHTIWPNPKIIPPIFADKASNLACDLYDEEKRLPFQTASY
jgi:hypothetical protein